MNASFHSFTWRLKAKEQARSLEREKEERSISSNAYSATHQGTDLPPKMVKTEEKIQAEEPNRKMAMKKKYKGVRMRSWGSWVSEIRAPNQKTRIWLGSYSTAEAAARAYDAALLCLKGSSATNLNFPISSYKFHLPPHTPLSPKSIQRVAAAAAANADNPAASPPSPPPPTSSFSSSYSASSPSTSSSPSNHIEDEFDISLVSSSLDAYTPYAAEESISLFTPWFDSPKYNDMINGALFDLPMIEDVYEEGDIRLWNFC
ncbi:hypothetical protein NMG60_11017668 [Bertholletia excelsa]